jgi:hypothetical protein
MGFPAAKDIEVAIVAANRRVVGNATRLNVFSATDDVRVVGSAKNKLAAASIDRCVVGNAAAIDTFGA